MKQISITLPIELHPLARELAARTKAGEPVCAVLDALKDLVCEEASVVAASGDAEPVALSYWRRWLIRRVSSAARRMVENIARVA